MDVPDWFARRLRDLDPNLNVYFNPHKHRWIIDRCTREGLHAHTFECPMTNVMIVQDEHAFMPLCERVIDRLKAMDAWTQHGTAENYQRHNANLLAEHEAKTEAAVDALYREASADNKLQLRKAYDLTQRHDTARVNQ